MSHWSDAIGVVVGQGERLVFVSVRGLVEQLRLRATGEEALRRSLADLVQRFSGVARANPGGVTASDLDALLAARSLLKRLGARP